MEAVEIDRKTFTFTWKIKNFSFSWHGHGQYILSPLFQVHKSDPASWRLKLYPHNSIDHIACILSKEKHAPASFLVSYELTFLTHNESSLNSVEVRDADFNAVSYSVPLNAHRGVVFGEERAAFLPNDTLTIQCRIWNSEGWISETRRCFAETEIEVERRSSFWITGRFSKIKVGDKVTERIDLKSMVIPCCIFSLYLKAGMYIIEINPLYAKSVKFCKCQLFLVDDAGKRIKCGSYGFLSNKKEVNTLSLMHCNLMQNKSRYLPNDVLSLLYLMEFSTGKVTGEILETDSSPNLLEFSTARNSKILETDSSPNILQFSTGGTTEKMLETGSSSNLLEVTDSVTTDNFPHSEEKYTESSLSWKDDLVLLFEDGLFCDTILKTRSESFPVHSLILRIRSPVFSDMLSVDASEGSKEGVSIEDLDVNTVRKMVSYLYTDTLDDLDWKGAKNLYCASDKYEIASLKQVCASFLKNKLEPTNCCEILCMASRYQDHGLISAVQCFISKHAKEILVSHAWINLEENDPLLACKTLRKLYLKK